MNDDPEKARRPHAVMWLLSGVLIYAAAAWTVEYRTQGRITQYMLGRQAGTSEGLTALMQIGVAGAVGVALLLYCVRRRFGSKS
jgi:hypothetical protein